MQKKGFIFDLDGVIVNTATYHYLAWKKIADELEIPFTKTKNEQLKGVSRIDSLKKILSWKNQTINQDTFNRLLEKKNNDYLHYISKMTVDDILPNVINTLKRLKNNNQQIALGSASKNAKIILEKIQLTHFFETIIDGNSVTKTKPNPEVFLNAAKNLKLPPEKCIVFEDSVAGIEAANSGGMISIGIGDKKTLSDARYNFKDFTEIKSEFLLKLINN